MRLSQLQAKPIITEGWNDPKMMLLETQFIQPWIKDIEKYVTEAALTQDQIKQMFGNIEQGATAAGGNRTMVGKGVDAAKFINDKINELGAAVQKAGPVQNADAKFEELKKKIGEKDNKVVQAVKAVSDWAKANPGKASIAVAILTVAAGIAGGPLAGAIGGFLARATKDLLKGEKLSTAVGKSMKTAAIGALVGAVADQIDFTDPPYEGGPNEVSVSVDGETTLEKLAAQAGEDSEVGTQISADPDNAAEIAFGEISEEAYKASYAEELLNRQIEKYGGEFTQEMMDKIADNIQLNGDYPNNFTADFEGTFVRGNIYLTPEEAQAYSKFLDSQPGDSMSKAFSNETNEWLKANVDGAETQIQAGADAAAAREAELTKNDVLPKDQVDAMSDKDIGARIKELKADPNLDANADLQNELKQLDRTLKRRQLFLSGHSTKPSLSEGQVYLLFNRITKANNHMLENKLMFESVFDAISHYNRQTINEAEPGVLSKVGGALKKVGSAAAGAIKGAAKQVTTKVTAEKLMTAWKKAGSPTDSDEVYNVIKGLGVADDVIKGTYDSMKIEVPKATDAPDADKDAGAADADTNADAPTDSTAGDGGSDTTDTGAANTNTGGDEPAATDDTTATDAPTGDTATSSADTGTGTTTSAKDERYYLQKNTKDETKVDIIDKQTSKPIKNGVALAPEKAEPMSDKMNKEAGKYAGAEGDKFVMQPNAQNPKTFDVLDTQTDQPVEKGAALQPGEAEELRDKLNSQSTTSTSNTSTDTSTTDGATDANTASTSGDTGTDATTTPQDGETPAQGATGGETPTAEVPPNPNNRGSGQGQDTAAPGGAAPVDVNALAAEIKKLKPEQIEDAKKLLAA